MKTSSPVAIVGWLSLAPAIASAQVCAGLAPFERGPLQALAATTKMHGVIRVGGGIAIGSQTGFARLRVGRNTFYGEEGAALEVAGTGGVEFPGGPRHKVRFCLLGSLAIASGPHDIATVDGAGTPIRVDRSAVEWSVGLTAGAVRSFTGRPLIFPTGSFLIVSTTARAKNAYSGTVDRESSVYGVIEAGVGVVLTRTVTVRPALTIPVGLLRASYGGSVTISTTFGGRRQPNRTRF